ncbi:MAG TPA: DUF3592 domain-containing protein [Pseudonocardia sp.]|nr:DUF3592 domain-containing protein [Pseudonocardia sp.]
MSAGRTTVERTRAIDELASLLRPVGVVLSRRLAEIVLGLAVLITVLSVFAIAGAAVDDRAIAANPATAQADVLEGSSFTRTLVRFTVANGEVWVPERGVFYPRGLQVGSTIAVEYDVTDPDLVRVAGRSALGSMVPLLLSTLAGWLVLGPLALWIRRRRSAAARP